MCINNDGVRDISKHHVICICGRCHTRRTAGGIAFRVSEAMVATYRQNPDDPRVDRLHEALELLNHVARTGIYPEVTVAA